jgi:hypothetical protein
MAAIEKEKHDWSASPLGQALMTVHNPFTDARWAKVKGRVSACVHRRWAQLKKCRRPQMPLEQFCDLALALAKYDLNGAPSNWQRDEGLEMEMDHEEHIFEWALWKALKAYPAEPWGRRALQRPRARVRSSSARLPLYECRQAHVNNPYGSRRVGTDYRQASDAAVSPLSPARRARHQKEIQSHIDFLKRGLIPDAFSDLIHYD